MSHILIELDPMYKDQLQSYSSSVNEEITIIDSSSFDGSNEILKAIIALSAGTIPFIAKIAIEAIRAKKHVVIKRKGITISGISENKILSLLQELKDED
ncbi:MAG: hypothetical protein ACYDBB_02165 [Armatimonadota bacterium]